MPKSKPKSKRWVNVELDLFQTLFSSCYIFAWLLFLLVFSLQQCVFFLLQWITLYLKSLCFLSLLKCISFATMNYFLFLCFISSFLMLLNLSFFSIFSLVTLTSNTTQWWLNQQISITYKARISTKVKVDIKSMKYSHLN